MLFPTLLSLSVLSCFLSIPTLIQHGDMRRDSLEKYPLLHKDSHFSDNSFFYMYIIIPYAEDLMYVYAKTSIL